MSVKVLFVQGAGDGAHEQVNCPISFLPDDFAWQRFLHDDADSQIFSAEKIIPETSKFRAKALGMILPFRCSPFKVNHDFTTPTSMGRGTSSPSKRRARSRLRSVTVATSRYSCVPTSFCRNSSTSVYVLQAR